MWDVIAVISEALSADSSGAFIRKTGSLMKVQPDSMDRERDTAARRLRTRLFNFITLSLFRGVMITDAGVLVMSDGGPLHHV